MSLNYSRQRLYIVSRESVVEARRLTDVDEDALILLVGRGLFLPVKLFDKKKIYAIAEEVKEQGLEGKLSDKVECLPANEVIDLILDNSVLNFS